METTNILKSVKSRMRFSLVFLKSRASGKNVWLGHSGSLGLLAEIPFGSNVFINKGCYLSARRPLKIKPIAVRFKE